MSRSLTLQGLFRDSLRQCFHRTNPQSVAGGAIVRLEDCIFIASANGTQHKQSRLHHSLVTSSKWPMCSSGWLSSIGHSNNALLATTIPYGCGPSRIRCMSAGSPEFVRAVEDPEDIRYRHTITSGRHVLKGDLAPEAGGTDAGPSPKELLMSGLALCTSMTIRMYADRKKWPLERVNVEVREFTKPGAHVPEELLVTVHLTGPLLDDSQRARLFEIGDRCPVKRMIKGEMPKGISSVLASKDLDHAVE